MNESRAKLNYSREHLRDFFRREGIITFPGYPGTKGPRVKGWNELTFEEAERRANDTDPGLSLIAVSTIPEKSENLQFGFLDFDYEPMFEDVLEQFAECPMVQGQDRRAKVLFWRVGEPITKPYIYVTSTGAGAIEVKFGKQRTNTTGYCGNVFGKHEKGMDYHFITPLGKRLPELTAQEMEAKLEFFTKKYNLVLKAPAPKPNVANVLPQGTAADAEGMPEIQKVILKYGGTITPDGRTLAPCHDDHNPTLKVQLTHTQDAKGRDLFNSAHCFACNRHFFPDTLEAEFLHKFNPSIPAEAYLRLLKREQKKADHDKNIVELERAVKEAGAAGEMWLKLDDLYPAAEEFIKKLPLHYDMNRIWWWWNKERCAWEQTDEVNLRVAFNKLLSKKSENPKLYRGGVWSQLKNALEEAARVNEPKPIKPSWVQFGKTIIEVDTGKRFPATSEYFVTNPIPHELGESEETPTIDKLMADWVGPDRVKDLTEVFAYCCLPSYHIAAIFLFVGDGHNGKDKCLTFLKRFIGEKNTTGTDLDLLTGQNARFETAKLYKKLMCWMGETNITALRNTSTLKRLSGESEMGFEFKHKMPFSGMNYARLFIASNSLPITFDKTKGFYRRMHPFKFDNDFEKNKGVPHVLETIPAVEYQNFAKKAARILPKLYQEDHFEWAGTSAEKAKQYEALSNSVGTFIDATYERTFDPVDVTTLNKLYLAYCAFCNDKKLMPVHKTTLHKILKQDGIFTRTDKWGERDNRIQGVKVYGLRLLNSLATPDTKPEPRTSKKDPTLTEAITHQTKDDSPTKAAPPLLETSICEYLTTQGPADLIKLAEALKTDSIEVQTALEALQEKGEVMEHPTGKWGALG